MHVLIVADDPNLQRVLTWLLMEEGFDVELVESPDAGLHAGKRKPPDLVIIDTDRPLHEKAAVVAVYKSEFPHVAVLDVPSSRKEQPVEGADVWLPKPFDADLLLEKVREALDSVRSRTECL
jgi:DNA-binding response OmpR family regulator